MYNQALKIDPNSTSAAEGLTKISLYKFFTLENEKVINKGKKLELSGKLVDAVKLYQEGIDYCDNVLRSKIQDNDYQFRELTCDPRLGHVLRVAIHKIDTKDFVINLPEKCQNLHETKKHDMALYVEDQMYCLQNHMAVLTTRGVEPLSPKIIQDYFGYACEGNKTKSIVDILDPQINEQYYTKYYQHIDRHIPLSVELEKNLEAEIDQSFKYEFYGHTANGSLVILMHDQEGWSKYSAYGSLILLDVFKSYEGDTPHIFIKWLFDETSYPSNTIYNVKFIKNNKIYLKMTCSDIYEIESNPKLKPKYWSCDKIIDTTQYK